jgi:hypothetical protein
LAIPFSLRWRGWHANTHVNVVEKRADNLRERQQPLSDLLVEHLPYPLSNRKPTHRIRVVLRTTDAQTGTNPYVDGSDFFLAVDEQQQTADFVWEDECFGETPLFHGGDVASAVRWVKELGEPFHCQYSDPFLLTETGDTTDQE